uniref:DUF38 domain-containing protein n=1 Tax=Panagrolaimus davidi TaxID=227884 RepID=A0A914QLT7_9BILA
MQSEKEYMDTATKSSHPTFHQSMIIYLIENASTPTLTKLYQCNKAMKALVKKYIKTFYCDYLYIESSNAKLEFQPLSFNENGYIQLNVRINDEKYFTGMKPLKVKQQLSIKLTKKSDEAAVDGLLTKIDISEIKSLLVDMTKLEKKQLLGMLNPKMEKIDLDITRVGGMNCLPYFLENFPFLTELSIPWRNEKTSLTKCSKITRERKLASLYLTNIREFIAPKKLVRFVERQMTKDAEVRFHFSWFGDLPDFYQSTMQAHLPESVSFDHWGMKTFDSDSDLSKN